MFHFMAHLVSLEPVVQLQSLNVIILQLLIASLLQHNNNVNDLCRAEWLLMRACIFLFFLTLEEHVFEEFKIINFKFWKPFSVFNNIRSLICSAHIEHVHPHTNCWQICWWVYYKCNSWSMFKIRHLLLVITAAVWVSGVRLNQCVLWCGFFSRRLDWLRKLLCENTLWQILNICRILNEPKSKLSIRISIRWKSLVKSFI